MALPFQGGRPSVRLELVEKWDLGEGTGHSDSPLLWAGVPGLHWRSLCARLEKGRLHSARSRGAPEGPAPAGTISIASLGLVAHVGR